MRRPLTATLVALAACCASARAADPPAPAARPSEFGEMLVSILARGAEMGPGSGWFHPSQGVRGWSWLANRFDANRDGSITADEMKGNARWFRVLDRDRDGAVTAEDLDWSPRSRYLQSRGPIRGLFGRLDRNGNGRISLEEWENVFSRLAGERGGLTQDDLADLLNPPPQPRPGPNPGEKRPAPSGPSRWTLFKGLMSGEIGSASEGPAPGAEAPDFVLDTHDGKQTISLSESRGKLPVVLIFGSFT